MQKLLQTNIYFVNVKVDGKYDCREKVPNIYEVNVKGDFPYDCREKVPNIYEVNVKAREEVLLTPAETLPTVMLKGEL